MGLCRRWESQRNPCAGVRNTCRAGKNEDALAPEVDDSHSVDLGVGRGHPWYIC